MCHTRTHKRKKNPYIHIFRRTLAGPTDTITAAETEAKAETHI